MYYIWKNYSRSIAIPYVTVRIFKPGCYRRKSRNWDWIVTVTAGVINMVGDALFMAVFQWGIAGAAMASALGQIVDIISIYFARKTVA